MLWMSLTGLMLLLMCLDASGVRNVGHLMNV